jgi:hypothetical protein
MTALLMAVICVVGWLALEIKEVMAKLRGQQVKEPAPDLEQGGSLTPQDRPTTSLPKLKILRYLACM